MKTIMDKLKVSKEIVYLSIPIITLVVLMIFFIHQIGYATVDKLSGSTPPDGDIFDFKVSPDGQYVVYRADQDTDDAIDLYSVKIDGGEPTRLSGLLPTGSQVKGNYLISPDSSRVVFKAPLETLGLDELYSVPIGGPSTDIVKLNKTLVTNGLIFEFLISPDSSRVIFRSDMEMDTIIELWSVPIDGPANDVVRLNKTLVENGDVSEYFLISQNSEQVVYRADQETDEVFELYSVPLSGPAEQSVKLNGSLVSGGTILFDDFLISPDSEWVVYRADQSTDDVIELYSVPIEGPASSGVKLNKLLVANGKVSQVFQISPDSSRVVYRGDQSADEVYELFSVPISGPSSAGVKLNKTLKIDGDVHGGFAISPDSQRIVYRAEQDHKDVIELYSVPITGPASSGVRLNNSLPVDGDIPIGFQISPDSQIVVYRADQHLNNVDELFSVPITGPSQEAIKLNTPFDGESDVSNSFYITPQNDRVIYRANHENFESFEIYSVPILGPSNNGVKLNAELIADGNVNADYSLNPKGTLAIYRADQDVDDKIELYSAEILQWVSYQQSVMLVSEQAITVSVPVQVLNATNTVTTTVDYEITGGSATGGGVDYSLTEGTLIYIPGEILQTIDIALINDQIDEPVETIIITLVNPQNVEIGPLYTIKVMIADEVSRMYMPLVH